MPQAAQQFFRKLIKALASPKIAQDPPAQIAEDFLRYLAGEEIKNVLPAPFHQAREIIYGEYEASYQNGRAAVLDQLEEYLEKDEGDLSQKNLKIWQALYPEVLFLDEDPQKQIKLLRQRRTVQIKNPVKTALKNPAEQILFTSNVLITPASENSPSSEKTASPRMQELIKASKKVNTENQLYWYDHPIPIGIPPKANEVLYGLAGMAQTLAYEKKRGSLPSDSRLTLALSLSVTHAGLHHLAGPWLRTQLSEAAGENLHGLNVFAFTEEDSRAIVDLLKPWIQEEHPSAQQEQEKSSFQLLRQTFGVDGEYGRHYSFLKAFPALWAILADPRIKATFKIDLDQVFPQEELVAETGLSAMEHFCNPLWGAQALDASGEPIELGMIAGALVNEKDITEGLFSPDIPWPSYQAEGENLLFYKQGPMAVSSRAEMMTRYGDPDSPDGKNTALERIHITGGTNGILLDALRRHRPFTPSFVGRAEDQAYLLGNLTSASPSPTLRYLHASGLIMRHDKENFAALTVAAGKAGSYVGDLIRLFVYSAFAQFLPGGQEALKTKTDPFTGSFITPMPATLALLRLALHLRSPSPSSQEDRQKLLNLAATRLEPWIKGKESIKNEMKKTWENEKKAWNAYYNALERLQKALEKKDPQAKKTQELFTQVLAKCRIAG